MLLHLAAGDKLGVCEWANVHVLEHLGAVLDSLFALNHMQTCTVTHISLSGCLCMIGRMFSPHMFRGEMCVSNDEV